MDAVHWALKRSAKAVGSIVVARTIKRRFEEGLQAGTYIADSGSSISRAGRIRAKGKGGEGARACARRKTALRILAKKRFRRRDASAGPLQKRGARRAGCKGHARQIVRGRRPGPTGFVRVGLSRRPERGQYMVSKRAARFLLDKSMRIEYNIPCS